MSSSDRGHYMGPEPTLQDLRDAENDVRNMVREDIERLDFLERRNRGHYSTPKQKQQYQQYVKEPAEARLEEHKQLLDRIQRAIEEKEYFRTGNIPMKSSRFASSTVRNSMSTSRSSVSGGKLSQPRDSITGRFLPRNF